jgi:hypothetical protein
MPPLFPSPISSAVTMQTRGRSALRNDAGKSRMSGISAPNSRGRFVPHQRRAECDISAQLGTHGIGEITLFNIASSLRAAVTGPLEVVPFPNTRPTVRLQSTDLCTEGSDL